MDGSILTSESFKEQVEQLNKENVPKQRKFKKKKIVSDTDEDEEISFHDESDYDKILRIVTPVMQLIRMKVTNSKLLSRIQRLENILQYTGKIHKPITGENF